MFLLNTTRKDVDMMKWFNVLLHTYIIVVRLGFKLWMLRMTAQDFSIDLSILYRKFTKIFFSKGASMNISRLNEKILCKEI